MKRLLACLAGSMFALVLIGAGRTTAVVAAPVKAATAPISTSADLRAANAAEQQIWPARLTVALSLVGTLAAIAAGGLAFRANRTAQRALGVAVKADAAHVLSEDVRPGGFYGSADNAVVVFNVANRGNSPAWVTGIGLKALVAPDLPETPPLIEMNRIRLHVLSPGGVERLAEPIDISADFPRWQTNEASIFLIGAFEFRDVFGDERVSHFAYRFVPHGHEDGGDTFVTWGSPAYWTYS